MAQRLASFKNRLAEKISVNLSKPIEIETLAEKGENIHRTLQKIKSLAQPPLIIIYLGNTDQSFEYTFDTKMLLKIQENFTLYKNDYIQTALMIEPRLSRLLYNPINYVELSEKIFEDQNKYDDQEYQKRTKHSKLMLERY